MWWYSHCGRIVPLRSVNDLPRITALPVEPFEYIRNWKTIVISDGWIKEKVALEFIVWLQQAWKGGRECVINRAATELLQVLPTMLHRSYCWCRCSHSRTCQPCALAWKAHNRHKIHFDLVRMFPSQQERMTIRLFDTRNFTPSLGKRLTTDAKKLLQVEVWTAHYIRLTRTYEKCNIRSCSALIQLKVFYAGLFLQSDV